MHQVTIELVNQWAAPQEKAALAPTTSVQKAAYGHAALLAGVPVSGLR
jgi:hypothetical protein